MGVCCCLQICNSVVNMVMMGLVLGQPLITLLLWTILCTNILTGHCTLVQNIRSVYTSCGFWNTGIHTEEQEWQQRQEELEKWTFFYNVRMSVWYIRVSCILTRCSLLHHMPFISSWTIKVSFTHLYATGLLLLWNTVLNCSAQDSSEDNYYVSFKRCMNLSVKR